MRPESLQLLEVLDTHPDEGVIRLRDERMVIQGAAALGLLRRELIGTLGAVTARRLLLRFGYADGYHDAVSLRDFFGQGGPLDQLRACLQMYRLEGIADARHGDLAFDPVSGSFGGTVTWRNSYEAEQHLLHGPASAEPVCWTLAGHLSGLASACVGTPVYFREDRCVGRGDAECRLSGRHATGWHEALPAVHEDFRGVDLQGEVERLRLAVARQRRRLERQQRGRSRRARPDETPLERALRFAAAQGFVVRSPAMCEALDLGMRVAPLDSTVLISGESGTGKEFFARLIHQQSSRADGPLVAINCAALTESLLEPELFGHERGAFTGAAVSRKGLFEQASGGTLFLDELGEMTPALQVKVLRALQEREIRRVGGTRTIPIDVRIVAATNRALRTEVAAGRFREDLYFRIAGLEVIVPPLRERRDEIPLLVATLRQRLSASLRKPVARVSSQAMRLLTDYPWPGNVRELEHAVERAVILARNATIGVHDLPPEVRHHAGGRPDATLDLRAQEARLIREALRRFRGHRRKAAAALGISTVSLWRKLKQLDDV